MRVLLLWLLLGALTAWMVDLAFEAALPAQTLIATPGITMNGRFITEPTRDPRAVTLAGGRVRRRAAPAYRGPSAVRAATPCGARLSAPGQATKAR